LKSPDSVKFGDYTRSFQLPNTWSESYARPVSVEISGLFKHPLKRFETAAVTIRGIELAEKIKKHQFNLKPLTGKATTAPETWAAVLAA
jgi:hypothetical protein